MPAGAEGWESMTISSHKSLFTGIILSVLSMAVLAGGNPKVEVEDSPSVDFGRYPAKNSKEAVFKIVNKGGTLLKIVRIRKTCTCIEVSCEKKQLEPEESAELRAVVAANSIYGHYSKTIYVETNDPEKRFLCLTVSGEATTIENADPADSPK